MVPLQRNYVHSLAKIAPAGQSQRVKAPDLESKSAVSPPAGYIKHSKSKQFKSRMVRQLTFRTFKTNTERGGQQRTIGSTRRKVKLVMQQPKGVRRVRRGFDRSSSGLLLLRLAQNLELVEQKWQ